MKALVTGANGFVGGYLVPALREAGWRVTTLSIGGPADLVLDLAADPIPNLRFGVVFHLAGFSNPSAADPGTAYRANALATLRLARAMRGGRLILASSGKVYPESPTPVDESRPPRPRDPYGASKLCAETVALARHADTVVLRAFNHTGPGQTSEYLCPQIAEDVVSAEAGGGRPVVRLRNPAARFDIFDVRDMVRAYLLASARGRPGEVYNVASGRATSVLEIAEFLVARSRRPLRIVSGPARNSVTAGDASKFRRATGWEPRIPLERTLADLLAHHRARRVRDPRRSAREEA